MPHISKFSDFLRKRNQLSTDIEKLKSQLNGLLKHNDINNLNKDAKYQNMDSVDKTLFLFKNFIDVVKIMFMKFF